ncbi:MAG TPA: bifunctional adenosylcobinamide kinase/adenosylcobinamide-phosphate guanylyltransferase [Lachnospiraceae bacterium]|nr:bifunctional adenosylcobinamide kinase/adenosylcobinamide-phosphate guanylyltransferase [Lachnospiraceae bacterium]
MILITGGSGSGKSAFAETLAQEYHKTGVLYYMAAMKCDTKEGRQRVLRHKRQRAGKGFITVEQPYDVWMLQAGHDSTILLECLSNLLANEWFDRHRSARQILQEIRFLEESCENLLIVTNEIFSDGIGYDEMTKDYIRQLGWLNHELAGIADTVYEVVYGIPVRIKG